jgi:hypothetical protein
MAVLEAYPAGIPAQPRVVIVQSRTKRLGNGVVQRAVAAALADGQPRSVREVADSVQEQLDRAVSIHSVNWCLSTGTLATLPAFQRVAPGRYHSIALPDESRGGRAIATVRPQEQASAGRPATRSLVVPTSSVGGVGRRARSAGKALSVVALVADMWVRRERRLPCSRSHCPARSFATDRLRGASTRAVARGPRSQFSVLLDNSARSLIRICAAAARRRLHRSGP